jgi:hypothetical protein
VLGTVEPGSLYCAGRTFAKQDGDVPEHRHPPTSFWRGKHGGLQQKRRPSRALAFSHWDGVRLLRQPFVVYGRVRYSRCQCIMEKALFKTQRWPFGSSKVVCTCARFFKGWYFKTWPVAEGSEHSTHVRRKRFQFWPTPILHGMHAPDDATHAAA